MSHITHLSCRRTPAERFAKSFRARSEVKIESGLSDSAAARRLFLSGLMD